MSSQVRSDPAERSLERREKTAMARTTMLAMKMGRNKGEDWRKILEEELAKKKKKTPGVKLEMEGKGKEKMMSGFLILEMRSGTEDEGGDDKELDPILVSL